LNGIFHLSKIHDGLSKEVFKDQLAGTSLCQQKGPISTKPNNQSTSEIIDPDPKKPENPDPTNQILKKNRQYPVNQKN
jgi:hypothetical protein